MTNVSLLPDVSVISLGLINQKANNLRKSDVGVALARRGQGPLWDHG
jgi:hypothetical protein